MAHGSFEFYLLVSSKAPNGSQAWIDIILTIYYASYVAGIIVMSSLVKREGQNTAVLVHRAINLDWNLNVIEKVSFILEYWIPTGF